MAILDPTALQRDLAGVVAECRPANSADPAIDGVRPAIVCRPGTPAEVAAVLAVADRHRAAVIPVGGGTKTGLGNPPRAAEILLRLDGLRQVGDFSPADLTAGCQAGLRWAEFQQHLAAAGQFVPLDPPFADRATVGGVLATNSFGP